MILGLTFSLLHFARKLVAADEIKLQFDSIRTLMMVAMRQCVARQVMYLPVQFYYSD
jgi:hypothetical protein